jgi:hypothetical protein
MTLRRELSAYRSLNLAEWSLLVMGVSDGLGHPYVKGSVFIPR